MANQMYNRGVDAFLKSQINWTSDDIRAILVDTNDYAVDLANDDALNDIPVAARTATVALTGRTTNGAGSADSSDPIFAGAVGDPSEALVLYKHVEGNEATSLLILYVDTAPGLPVTPNGGDIAVTVNSSGWFKL